DLAIGPPGFFVRALMQLPVMTAAERHSELIAHFEAQGSRLGKPQVMRIARLASADETRLGGHESEMGFVAKTFGLSDGENALVDLRRDQTGCGRDNRGVG